MYPRIVYHADERARKIESAERQMRCCCIPLGRMISRVINGRIRYDERMDYAMAYAPAKTCYVRPTAPIVTLSTNKARSSTHAVQPAEPLRPHATTTLASTHCPAAGAAPQGGSAMTINHKKKKKNKKNKQQHVGLTAPSRPVPGDAPSPHTKTVSSSVYQHGGPPADPWYTPAPPAPAHGHGRVYGYGRYAPSPLPRWEMLDTPRRHEYFSSEYRWYYPTPVREGIYSIATDANGRLSTIFSEENPNACTIF